MQEKASEVNQVYKLFEQLPINTYTKRDVKRDWQHRVELKQLINAITKPLDLNPREVNSINMANFSRAVGITTRNIKRLLKKGSVK